MQFFLYNQYYSDTTDIGLILACSNYPCLKVKRRTTSLIAAKQLSGSHFQRNAAYKIARKIEPTVSPPMGKCYRSITGTSPKPKMIAELEEILLWQPNSGSDRRGCKSFHFSKRLHMKACVVGKGGPFNFVSIYFFSLNDVILLCDTLDVFEHAKISRPTWHDW